MAPRVLGATYPRRLPRGGVVKLNAHTCGWCGREPVELYGPKKNLCIECLPTREDILRLVRRPIRKPK